MLDEPNALDAPGAAAQPHLTSDSTAVRRSLRQPDAFDVASTSKRAVARLLSGWYAERQRLNGERIRRRQTTRGDKLVVDLVRMAGVSFAVGTAVVGATIAYSAWGLVAALAVGGAGLVVMLAVASGVTLLTRALFDRSERLRSESVARLEAAIRRLDVRIDQAFRVHGLVHHNRTRSSF